jgi:molybdate transport system regulatory protein
MKVKSRVKKGVRSAWVARPRWRLSGGQKIALGPGKADLLEAIERTGSISGGARALGMSYRRAWLLVDTMNGCFVRPLVVTSKWRGKGAWLTNDGRKVLRLYRRIESRSKDAVEPLLKGLQGFLKPTRY